jgi:hypothetical protein
MIAQPVHRHWVVSPVLARMGGRGADAERRPGKSCGLGKLTDDPARLDLEFKGQPFVAPVFVGAKEAVVVAIDDVEIFPLRPVVRRVVVIVLDRLAAGDDNGTLPAL